MIGRLRGELLEKQPPQLLVDVNGVGYELEASMNTFYRLPERGKQVVLYTHFVVREDAQLLYGFADRDERSLFRALIKVNGVGPKLALTILSGIDTETFIAVVNQGDTASLVRLPGVGKKTAERLIVEMKDRLKELQVTDSGGFQLASPAAAEGPSASDLVAEAESALVALGYKPAEASRSVSKAARELGASASSEALIRQALKSMVGGL
ncbi:Holliday junction ATP-dependent DNA helicase RuvA [Marinobacterium nitratireducens]|uniref:Holliday junction branch migration complex subunit RuvA n=1 Tax=Marinobacterium nitratireducens TaxID=518897 RepID=A0A918DS46_9GAMM|nr:Holliday junction branch migration protein RuvA [Marinobacterium nitratireducens]GGO80698.1 Holliday junction ATP-dependent DNA helicase RuvA [Marinobacterium nitratireducens]